MYCFIEIKDKEIVSYGETTSVELALSRTTGKVMEITEKQLALVTACHGDLKFAQGMLGNLEYHIEQLYESEQLDKSD